MAPPVTINPNNSGTIEMGLVSADQPYGDQVTNWQVQPAANTTRTPGTFGAPPQDRNLQSSFGVSFDYLQDWGEANSLSQFLQDNDGALVFFKFTPDDTNVPTCDGQFYVHAGPYGGPAGEDWTSTGQFPVKGVPNYAAQP